MRADNDNTTRGVISGDGNLDVVAPMDCPLSEEAEYRLSHPLRMLGVNLLSMRARSSTESTVYVIADIYGTAVKIGEAKDPNKRLLQLQAGNPNRLYIHRAFWFPSKISAQYVEYSAHKRAADSGYKRLSSEWFSCSPKQAHEAILYAIDFLRVSTFGIATPGSVHWGHVA